MGCGGCASVCPSGAMSFAYPAPSSLGTRLRAALSAYRAGGGVDACLLFHDGESGLALIESLARPVSAGRLAGRGPARGRPDAPGLPADLVPVQVHHPASVGLDLALAAIAWGAASVTVLFTPDTAEEYAVALERQFETGRRLLAALGLPGPRLVVLSPRGRRLQARRQGQRAQGARRAPAGPERVCPDRGRSTTRRCRPTRAVC